MILSDNKSFTKKILLACLLVVAAHTTTQAQPGILKGRLRDTSSSAPVFSNATVYLVYSADSVLAAFTRCDEEGRFQLRNLPQARYQLLIRYPGYAEYMYELDLTTLPEYDLGVVNLKNKVKMLEEVVVKGRVPSIRIRGDTTEYKADSFYVPPNATVQELLKRLPGMQVNARGEVYAQDVRVEKILVDGEEFFSDDPAVVIQNLRADYIDRVQVFDMKSDKATFTGIDDGSATKTINLRLKEDKRMSFFGKAEAGGGTGNYYFGKAMINSFNKRSRVAAFVAQDNTRYQSLNFDEQNNFSTNLNMASQIHDDGTMSIQSSSDEFGWGRGLPVSITGGFTYNTRWDNDAQRLNNSYQYNNLEVDGEMNTQMQTFLPGVTYNSTREARSVSKKMRHLFNSEYEWKRDTSLLLKFSGRANLVQYRETLSVFEATSASGTGLLNNNLRGQKSSGNKNYFKTSLLVLKRLRKPGSSISFAADINHASQNGDATLVSSGYYFNTPGNVIDSVKLNQFRPHKVNDDKQGFTITYAQALSPVITAEVSYLLAYNRNYALKNTFATDLPGAPKKIDTLSSQFRFNNTLHAGGLHFRIKRKKIQFSLGSAIGTTTYRITDIDLGRQLNRQFFAIMPNASFVYTKNRNTRFKLNYSGQPQNPSVTHIQPFRDNSNPLDITVGNINLNQAFQNNIGLEYTSLKSLKGRVFSVQASASSIKNGFSYSGVTDTLGRRISNAININGNRNASLSVYSSRNIGKGVQWSFAASAGSFRFANMVNNLRNITNGGRFSVETGLQKYTGSKLSFTVNVRPVYEVTRSSVNISDHPPGFWTLESNPSLDMALKNKWFISLSSELYIYTRTQFVVPENIILLNASVKKFFSKGDKWMIMFSVNDLLNRNAAIERSLSSNFISQTWYNNIRRYALLSLAYNFSKIPVKK
ncbi:MAG: outer membrane beta-barrel protein [Dinghuibacter sp.]|nr:outer membrane beta-barrel protein [Dinghuibacter sp.]